MNETCKTIHGLRSTHGDFSERAISREDLQMILDACVRTANASARQSYSIVVVEDRAVMKKLCGYAGSRALLFCADYNRIVDAAAHLGHSFAADGVVPFVTASTDTILAAQTAAIAARSLGIDSLFTNGIHRGDIRRVYELLDLPETYCFPLIMLVLGYANQEPDHLKGRLSDVGVVHWGKYHRPTSKELDELVQQYDDAANHLALGQAWKAQGLAHSLDLFYTVWSVRGGRREGGPRAGRSQMCEMLEKAGFWDAACGGDQN
jgi:nitroreductase